MEIENLITQLPSPFLLMGDINSHHPILGSNTTNATGRSLERILDQNDICLLNDGTGTRLDIISGETSSPDVTLCSTNVRTRLEWTVIEEKFHSDHFAILVRDNVPVRVPTVRRFALQRANWNLFKRVALIHDNNFDDVDGMLDIFETSVNNAALEAIPHTYEGMRRIPVPWWSEECKGWCPLESRE